MSDVRVRRARLDDHEDVVAFTRDTWSDRHMEDYIPDVFPDWVRSDGDDQRTLVAAVDGRAVGLCQAVLLSEYEAWVQGIRVHPDYRGRGVGGTMTDDLLSWCRDRGAAVARNIVFSWNGRGLRLSRSVGFEPVAAFRWASPEPDDGAAPAAEIGSDPDAAWAYWQRCEARTALSGLALDPNESWALSDLTRKRLAEAADETFLGVVRDGGTRGFAFRNRDLERERDGERQRIVEYGVGAWDSIDGARALSAAIARDAAGLDADRTRVLVPESPRAVSDVAAAGAAISDESDFVMAADLTDPGASFGGD